MAKDILVRMKADTGNYDANIAKARKQLDGFAKDNLTAGGAVKGMTSQVVAAAAKFASFAAAGKAAFETVKGVMNATERSADALASAQMQLNSAVESFFRNINEGNFASFLSGLSDVASRAQEAYAAMDELSSFAVRYNPKNKADMAKIDALMKEARALMAKGDKEGANAKVAAAQAVATQARKNTLAYGEKEYNAGVSTLRNLLGGTGVTYTNKQLEWYSDPANWDRINQKAREYEAIQAKIEKLQQGNITATSYDASTRSRNRAEIARLEASITPEQRRAYNYINTRDTAGTEKGDMFARATEQIYGKQMAQYAADAIQARIDRQGAIASKTSGGGGGGSTKEFASSIKLPELGNATIGTTASMKELQAQLARYKSQLESATNSFDYMAAQAGIEKTQKQIAAQPMAIQAGLDVDTMVAVQDNLDEEIKRIADNIEPLEIKVDIDKKGLKGMFANAEEMGEAWKNAASAIKLVGSAISGIENPAAKVASIIAETVATIAMAYAETLAKDKTSKSNIFGFIAASTAAMISMTTSIAAVKKATAGSYADGGIVPGNSYSGDNQLIMANAGEVVLNASQVNTLSNRLNGAADSAPRNSYITGEQIVTVVNAYGRRSGRGEILR